MSQLTDPLAGFRPGDAIIITNEFDASDVTTFSTVEDLVRHLRTLPVGSGWFIRHERDGQDVSHELLFPMAVLDAYRGRFTGPRENQEPLS